MVTILPDASDLFQRSDLPEPKQFLFSRLDEKLAAAAFAD
jgi:hypothetical protein